MNEYNFLMSSPEGFAIRYEINPWMNMKVPVDIDKAKYQWNKLFNIYNDIGIKVDIIDAPSDLPDMVFTANAGLIYKKKFFPSNFRYQQRKPERKLFMEWFKSRDYEIIDIPDKYSFEGAGDAILCDNRLYLGYGFRSHKNVKEFLEKSMEDIEIVLLGLANPYFYHLDTCFSPLPSGGFIYYPDAFDDRSRLILRRYGGFPVTEKFCVNYGCNMIFVDNILITGYKDSLTQDLADKFELNIITTEVTEFLKAGGGVRCLTLFI